MSKSIVVIDGHPDPDPARLCHALAAAYSEGAQAAGHRVVHLTLARIAIDPVRTRADWEDGVPGPAVRDCQHAVGAADHLVIIYPLWLGSMPALLKAFFEQVFRPGFAVKRDRMQWRAGLLQGKSARVVVTMGMPAFAYRWFFGAHSLKTLKRNILSFSGIGPIRNTLIGNVEGCSAESRTRLLATMRELGHAGS